MDVQKTGVHCKVVCNGELRRFLFNGTEFRSLYQQVKLILNLDTSKEFVLKYTDEEGDLVTISSDDELACALQYTQSPNLLRLTAVFEETKESVPVSCEFENFGGRGCRRGRGRGRGKGECAGGPYERQWNKDKCCLPRHKLEKRREKIQNTIAYLSEMSETSGNPKFREHRIAKLKERLTSLEQKIQNTPETTDGVSQRRNLSPEEMQQVSIIKGNISSLKAILGETKRQIWAKRDQFKLSHDDKQRELLKTEIQLMKTTVQDLKNQIHELHQTKILIVNAN